MFLVVAVLVSGLAHGCANAEALREARDVPRVLIEVRWVANTRELYDAASKVEGACNGAGLCRGFSQSSQLANGTWICLITMARPADWDDRPALVALGHETMHCLGYEHH
jgi:hypothetical protein